MNKKFIIFPAMLSLAITGMSQNVPQMGSLSFHFKHTVQSQTPVLSLDYMQNGESMATLADGIRSDKRSFLEGRRYISIVPCIRRDQIGNADAVNRASLQASVIRAFLKQKYSIPHSCIAFSIDTTQNTSDVAMVNIIDGELPQGDKSGIIHYILHGSPGEIFSKYNFECPYGNLWMIQARASHLNEH